MKSEVIKLVKEEREKARSVQTLIYRIGRVYRGGADLLIAEKLCWFSEPVAHNPHDTTP